MIIITWYKYEDKIINDEDSGVTLIRMTDNNDNSKNRLTSVHMARMHVVDRDIFLDHCLVE